MAKVSVIIPVYNVEQYLAECMESILNQSLRDIEIICVNDGSTDGSPAILDEYTLKDSRIQVITQKNSGLSATRNVGIEHAKGTYVYFMDSDDMLQPSAFMELYTIAEQEKLDIVYFDASIIYESDELAKEYSAYTTTYSYVKQHDYSEVINGINMFVAMYMNGEYRSSACMQFIRTEHIRKHNLSFYEGILHEDELFNFLCIMQARKVSHISKQYYIRRIRIGSIMTQAKGFRHFYGYLVCYIQIIAYSVQNNLSREAQKCINNLLENFRNNINMIYISTSDSKPWLDMLSETERYLFSKIIVQSKDDDLRKRKWLPRKIMNGFRCISEHGLLYTIKLAGKKLSLLR